MWCLSVCVSVCLSHSWILSKWINISSNFFHSILYFFLSKRHGNIVTGTPPPNTGVDCRWNRDSESISGFITCCKHCDQIGVINMAPLDCGKWWHLSLVVSGRACCWREMMTKCLLQEVSTLRQVRRSLIVCSDKSVAYVTNNKRLRSTFCTIEANYWQTRSIALQSYLLHSLHRRRKERKSGRACEALRVEAGWGFWERELASIPPARGLRSIVSSPPAGSRAEPQRKLIFVQFLVWRLPLAATTCTLFQVILCR